jgi:hypothetical protein
MANKGSLDREEISLTEGRFRLICSFVSFFTGRRYGKLTAMAITVGFAWFHDETLVAPDADIWYI